jgi:hypothetical protein
MADALTTITNLIQSPPGQLVAGGVLAGIVWKFFGRVESVLTDQTKLEIAVWLVGVTTSERWRSVMTVYVNAVCGSSIFSVRSILVTLATGVVAFCVPAGSLVSSLSKTTNRLLPAWSSNSAWCVGFLFLVCISLSWIVLALIDYEARRVRIGLQEVAKIVGGTVVFNFGLLFLLFIIEADSIGLAGNVNRDSAGYYYLTLFRRSVRYFPALPVLTAALICTSWLWLYAGSGFLLKVARRFDFGFDWFNRKFDIEKKPLQSIGLVAGALVAVVYWTWAIVTRLAG